MRRELSPRQWQCLICAARGLTVEQTALRLDLSESMVEQHVGMVRLKLLSASITQAVVVALWDGHITFDEIRAGGLEPPARLVTPPPHEKKRRKKRDRSLLVQSAALPVPP